MQKQSLLKKLALVPLVIATTLLPGCYDIDDVEQNPRKYHDPARTWNEGTIKSHTIFQKNGQTFKCIYDTEEKFTDGRNYIIGGISEEEMEVLKKAGKNKIEMIDSSFKKFPAIKHLEMLAIDIPNRDTDEFNTPFFYAHKRISAIPRKAGEKIIIAAYDNFYIKKLYKPNE